MKLKSQKGIGLLELMLAMAIIAILTLMATKYFTSTKRDELVTQGITLVQDIVSASASYVPPSDGSAQVASKSNITASGMLPEQYAGGNTPWNGATWTVNSSNTSSNDVQVGITGLPAYACTDLVNKFKSIGNVTDASSCSGGSFDMTFQSSTGATS